MTGGLALMKLLIMLKKLDIKAQPRLNVLKVDAFVKRHDK